MWLTAIFKLQRHLVKFRVKETTRPQSPFTVSLSAICFVCKECFGSWMKRGPIPLSGRASSSVYKSSLAENQTQACSCPLASPCSKVKSRTGWVVHMTEPRAAHQPRGPESGASEKKPVQLGEQGPRGFSCRVTWRHTVALLSPEERGALWLCAEEEAETSSPPSLPVCPPPPPWHLNLLFRSGRLRRWHGILLGHQTSWPKVSVQWYQHWLMFLFLPSIPYHPKAPGFISFRRIPWLRLLPLI